MPAGPVASLTRGFTAGNFSSTTRAILPAPCPRSIGSVVGRIKPRALENKPPTRSQDASDRPATLGADRDRLIAHLLEDFKLVATGLTLVFIRWHGFNLLWFRLPVFLSLCSFEER